MTREEKPREYWYDIPSNKMTLEQAQQAVRDLRKKLLKYSEQEPVLDKIRAEIIAESFPEDEENSFSKIVYLGDVLQIIDKYKIESEE